jgi:anti-sigma B factor antagonist
MTSARSVTVRAAGPAVHLSGELDAAGAQGVHTALSDRVGHGEDDVVVDIAELTFIDSIGIGALAKAAGQLDRQGRRLRLVGARGPVRDAIESTGLAERLGMT